MRDVESVMGSTILRTRIRPRTPYVAVGVGVRLYLCAFVQVRGCTPVDRDPPLLVEGPVPATAALRVLHQSTGERASGGGTD